MNITTKQLNHFEFELFKQYSSHDVQPIAKYWRDLILNQTSAVEAQITGELRRGKSSISHIDILVGSENIPQTNMEISGLPGIVSIIDNTPNSLEIQIHNEISVLIWFSVPSVFPTALLYTTGPLSHTDWLNKYAGQKDKYISFHGCWESKRLMMIKDEKALYQFLGLPYIPPEIRERDFDHDQIVDLYFRDLIEPEDIVSDLHVHTTWSDGKSTLEEMVLTGIDHGLSLIAITDHSPYVLRPRYQNAEYFLNQSDEIRKIAEKYDHQIKILKGCEVDILPDGNLDLPEDILQKMDIVIASLHVCLDQPRAIITDRLIKAIENPFVDIIGHPGGRLFPMHDTADLDWERIYHAAAFHRVALEINSHKSHPLFDESKVRMAAQAGAPICLNSDAHSSSMLEQSVFGINIARRAGLEKDQVLNTWSPARLINWLNKSRT